MLKFVNQNNPYKSYKTIKDDLLFQIPNDWIFKRLQFVATISNSNVDKKIN